MKLTAYNSDICPAWICQAVKSLSEFEFGNLWLRLICEGYFCPNSPYSIKHIGRFNKLSHLQAIRTNLDWTARSCWGCRISTSSLDSLIVHLDVSSEFLRKWAHHEVKRQTSPFCKEVFWKRANKIESCEVILLSDLISRSEYLPLGFPSEEVFH